ncbi:MAG: glucose 1-dehydrogenase [Candidatus Marinimicrobia bacterium]|nr:glucose 1-dehydrogenase [Candidatus Neomarinimicrobiota bacterium]MCF7828130.1 glucose 1-dehydrogenase [Candidatus Neomarinimicrobiota bacterium]MCF7879695.1 glucose 1-dehydrogenase [Candidatus Neomarinimicrobiota bacterium]
MKAIAVAPGEKNSIHLRDIPKPSINEIAAGCGVLVRVLRVGVDATDKEINDAEYGAAPEGDDYLIIGHESFGVVEEIGENVERFSPGDYVAATVRRPGDSLYDRIGLSDMSSDEEYYERGINRLHGFLAEYFVESENNLAKVPGACRDVGVLMEPTSIVVKGIRQAFEIQRRMQIWQPKRAAVMGTGTLGLLATMILRLRDIDVVAFGLDQMPYKNGELVEQLGGRYFSVKDKTLGESKEQYGPYDLIFEATGNSGVAFEATEHLGKNGVLILTSITGGERKTEIPSDKINLEFVLGNKVMFGTVSSNLTHFQLAAKDLSHAVSQFPGWLNQLLTHPVKGLEEYETMIRLLESSNDAIKIFVEV